MSVPISEYITFGDFNSQELGLYISNRDAPTPAEKEVNESLNYMNSVLDFSEITGERYYSNRTITYTFVKPGLDYEQRKAAEIRAKQLLMKPYNTKLYDTHDLGYYWMGKCKSVKATDSTPDSELTLVVEFDIYPFAIQSQDLIDSDNWDAFDFENGFIQQLEFDVVGKKQIRLYNTGQNRITPTVVCDDDMKITVTVLNGWLEQPIVFHFNKQKNSDFLFSLAQGMNTFTIEGNGHVEFVIRPEVMI